MYFTDNCQFTAIFLFVFPVIIYNARREEMAKWLWTKDGQTQQQLLLSK